VDVDGDGVADFVQNIWVGGVVYSGAWRNKAGRGDLLATITNGQGAVVELAYAPMSSSAVYQKDPQHSAYPVRDLQSGFVVVSSVKTSNGVDAAGRRETTHFYRNAKTQLNGAGFLGFGAIEATDTQSGIRTVRTFRQDYPFQGLTLGTQRLQRNGAVLSQTANSWSDNPPGNSVAYPNPAVTGRYHRCDLTQSVESGGDLSGAVLPTVTTTSSYDAFGNATSVMISTGDGYSKTTANTYNDDTINWLLGRLTSSRVTSTTP
jgi:hypothetical protein